MISQYLKAPPFTHIELIVKFQLGAVCVLSVVILFLLIHRNRKAVRVEKLKAFYADGLVSEMLAFLEGSEFKPIIQPPTWYESGDRIVLQTVLLEHFSSVSGQEKEFLARRYADFHFSEDDAMNSRSLVWWRRLQAVSNMSLVGSLESAPTLRRLFRDRNSLVSATASLALSHLDHELNRPTLISRLPKRILQRKNLLHEILKNWARVHGSSAILEQIPKVSDPTLVGVLVRAAATLQSPEVSDTFSEILSRRKDLPAAVVQEMLVLLRRVGDPAHSLLVRTFVNHEQEVIRLRAMEYLIAIGEFDILDDASVRSDRSALVQRWLKGQTEGLAA